MNEHEPDGLEPRGAWWEHDEPANDALWSNGRVDHERIDELLAAHALHALDGEDLRLAERVLTEHLPTCERCRATTDQFRAITADLALGSRPAPPPEMLLPRLRMQTMAVPVDAQSEPRRSRPRRAVGSWLSAAAALVLIGLVLWNAFLHVRLGQLSGRQQDIARVTNLISQPDARRVRLDSVHTRTHVLFGYREAQVALFGSDVEAPAKGDVYRLWLGRDNGHFDHVADFVPNEGVVALVFEFDAHEYDRILITEEPAGSSTGHPTGDQKWAALLRPKQPVSADRQSA
jgi:Anti-sigma-K factor rskA, C-terminal